MAQLTIGIDLGGTKIAAGLVDSNGKLLHQTHRPTAHPDGIVSPQKHIKHVVNAMANSVEELISKIPGSTPAARRKRLAHIGLASAGPLDVLKGKLLNPSNFPGWKTVPIVTLLEKELRARGLRRPVHFQNDAIAAALGEGWVGAARDSNTFVIVTLGTGIGSGVILNGQPAQSNGMGSEWGLMLIDRHVVGANANANTKDFYHASVEGLASGTGLRRRAESAGLKFNMMRELAVLARDGDKTAQDLFADASHALAMLFYNLSLGYHVEKILVTGGLMHIQDMFLPQAKTLYESLISKKNSAFKAKVVPAKLENTAGLIGAARLGSI